MKPLTEIDPDLYRLTQVTRDGQVIEAYTFDANSNRLMATIGGSPIQATYKKDSKKDRVRSHKKDRVRS